MRTPFFINIRLSNSNGVLERQMPMKNFLKPTDFYGVTESDRNTFSCQIDDVYYFCRVAKCLSLLQLNCNLQCLVVGLIFKTAKTPFNFSNDHGSIIPCDERVCHKCVCFVCKLMPPFCVSSKIAKRI